MRMLQESHSRRMDRDDWRGFKITYISANMCGNIEEGAITLAATGISHGAVLVPFIQTTGTVVEQHCEGRNEREVTSPKQV